MPSSRFALAAAALVVVACSPTSERDPLAGGTTAQPDTAAATSPVGHSADDPAPGEIRRTVGPAPVPTRSTGGASARRDGGRAPAPQPVRIHPPQGAYAFAQRGFEAVCRAGACSRRDLPPRQDLTLRVARRDEGTALVVQEMTSGDWYTRTHMRFGRHRTHVLEVHVEVQFGAVTFAETYRPQPPVEALRWPLRPGARWSGSWSAGTSGDYRVDVIEQERVRVGGAAVDAIKIETATTFRGDFSGKADILAWIDPIRRVVVKTAGRLDLRSRYGDYHSSFVSRLRRGPGYR